MKFVIRSKFNQFSYYLKRYTNVGLILSFDKAKAKIMDKNKAKSIFEKLEKNPLTRGMYQIEAVK